MCMRMVWGTSADASVNAARLASRNSHRFWLLACCRGADLAGFNSSKFVGHCPNQRTKKSKHIGNQSKEDHLDAFQRTSRLPPIFLLGEPCRLKTMGKWEVDLCWEMSVVGKSGSTIPFYVFFPSRPSKHQAIWELESKFHMTCKYGHTRSINYYIYIYIILYILLYIYMIIYQYISCNITAKGFPSTLCWSSDKKQP